MTDSAMNVIIVGGAPELTHVLTDACREAGFRAALVPLTSESISVIQEHLHDLIILVADQPGPEPLETMRSIRAVSSTSILMLSVLSEPADVVQGFDAGADDFLTLPIRPRELSARLEALMRRSTGQTRHPRSDGPTEAPVAATVSARDPSSGLDMIATEGEDRWLTYGRLALNQRSRIVLVGQREITLTSAEFDVLATLLQSKRRVRNLSDLAIVMRGEPTGEWYEVDEVEKARVDACIVELRRKLGELPDGSGFIESGPGFGYRLSPQ